MNLTVFDERQGCYILNPAAFPNIINAFHPDYVKTYHPDLCREFRTNKAAAAEKADLKVKEFFTYQKAGMPKGKKK